MFQASYIGRYICVYRRRQSIAKDEKKVRLLVDLVKIVENKINDKVI